MRQTARILLTSAFGVALILAAIWSLPAQVPSPQATLTQSVADLQKSPTDAALREQIIKLVLEMKPAPTVPEEVKGFMASGTSLFIAAKVPEDFKQAAAEFEKATLAAPWLAEAYYNLGTAQEKAGMSAEAAESLRLYLLAAPKAPDAKAVGVHLNGLQQGLLKQFLADLQKKPDDLTDQCPTCQGQGTIPCPACNGTGIAGYVDVHGQQGAYGCERCGGVRGSPFPGDPGYGTGRAGSGRITCPTCGGSGQVQGQQPSAANQPPPPDNSALREKIIRLVLVMDPKPSVPAEAERYGNRAEFAVRDAKSPGDLADAAKEYEKALLIAPWVAAYYFNCGVIQERASLQEQAIRSYKLYLLAAPDAQDAKDVRKRIDGLEYLVEKAAKEKTEAKAAVEVEAKPRSLEGTWEYLLNFGNGWVRSPQPQPTLLKIFKGPSGDWAVDQDWRDTKMLVYDVRQSGETISFAMLPPESDPELNTSYYQLALSPDGTRLVGTMRTVSIGGDNPHWETVEVQLIRH